MLGEWGVGSLLLTSGRVFLEFLRIGQKEGAKRIGMDWEKSSKLYLPILVSSDTGRFSMQ